MNFKDFVQEQILAFSGLKTIIDKLKSVKNKNCLMFIHDDPDGLTGGVILLRLLNKLGAKVTLQIPETMELEKYRIENHLQLTTYDLLFIVDKATMWYYNEYPDLIKDVIIIDHHPLIGEFPSRCIVFNPSIPNYTLTSTAFMCNILSEAIGLKDDIDDFQALIGLKADWAIDPATDFVGNFCKEFYKEQSSKYKNLLRKINTDNNRATMFEVNQRAFTTVLNQISEFFFALSGGGFQYFYNDKIEEFKSATGRTQVEFAFELLENLNSKDYNSLDEFISYIPVPTIQLAKKIYQCFLDDWNNAVNMFNNTVLIDTIKDTKVFLFIGNKVPLMPMVGSVKLYELCGSQPGAIVMINQQNQGEGRGGRGGYYTFFLQSKY